MWCKNVNCKSEIYIELVHNFFDIGSCTIKIFYSQKLEVWQGLDTPLIQVINYGLLYIGSIFNI